MAKDITLKTRNGETRYPKSVTALIYENGTGKTLQTIIDEMRQVDAATNTRTQHFKADVNNLDTLKNKTDIGLYNYVGTGWRGSVSVCYDSADNVSQVALSSSTPSYNGNTLTWIPAQPCAMARTYTNGAWSHWEKVGAPVVNDLTTGGTDKALSAEMGKTLKEGLDALGPKIDGKILDENFQAGSGYTYSTRRGSWFALEKDVQYTIDFTSASALAATVYVQMMTEEGNENSNISDFGMKTLSSGSTSSSFSFTPSQDYPNVFIGTGTGSVSTLHIKIVGNTGIVTQIQELSEQIDDANEEIAASRKKLEDLSGVAVDEQMSAGGDYNYNTRRGSLFSLYQGVTYTIKLTSETSLANTVYFRLMTSELSADDYISSFDTKSFPSGRTSVETTFTPNQDYTGIFVGTGAASSVSINVKITSSQGVIPRLDAVSQMTSNIKSTYDKILMYEPLKSQYFDDASLGTEGNVAYLLRTNGSNECYRGQTILGIRVMCSGSGTFEIIKGLNIKVGDGEMPYTTLQTYSVVQGENVLILSTPITLDGENDYIGVKSDKLRSKSAYDSSNVCFLYFNTTTNKVASSVKDLVCAVICSTVKIPEEGEESNETKIQNLQKAVVGIDNLASLSLCQYPYYYHWSPNSFVNGVIPSQSVEDNVLAKRLGFLWVEANTQETATEGKFVVTHGNAGKFGQEFSSTYENVAINSMSYADIIANVKYNSTQACYNHTISTLDAFCANCSQLGLGILLRTGQQAIVDTARKYLRDDMLVLPGDTANPRKIYDFRGLLYSFFSGSGSAEVCNATYLKNYVSARGGSPYLIVLEGAAIEYMITQGTLESIVGELKANGILLGAAYASSDTLDKLTAIGGIGHAAQGGQCNPFYDANVGTWSPLDADLSGWDIPSGATISGGRIVNEGNSNIIVKTPSTGVIPLGKGQIEARVKGDVAFTYGMAGSTANVVYSENSEDKPILVARAGFGIDMRLTITIGTNSSVEFLIYRVSRC